LNAQNGRKTKQNQCNYWDTNSFYGALKNNGLPAKMGHSFRSCPKNNPGSAATETGIKATVKASSFLWNSTSNNDAESPIILATNYCWAVMHEY
jgi:hypothetical protein